MVVSDLQLGVLSFGEIKHKLLKDLSGPSPLVNLMKLMKLMKEKLLYLCMFDHMLSFIILIILSTGY